MPHPLPLFSCAEGELRGHEEHPEMENGEPAFHALEVGPDATHWIDAEQSSDQRYDGKGSHPYRERRELGSISDIPERQYQPSCESELHEDTEVERLAGNEREEVAIDDDQWEYGYQEESGESKEASDFLQAHDMPCCYVVIVRSNISCDDLKYYANPYVKKHFGASKYRMNRLDTF